MGIIVFEELIVLDFDGYCIETKPLTIAANNKDILE